MIWEKIKQVQEKRQRAVLCTIVKARGSTPRKEGSKLLVVEDGNFYGTVGGGNLEYEVIEVAKEVLKTQKAQLLDFNLGKELKMACGGQVSLFLEPILPPEQLIIFGAGHVGQALAYFASKLDFQIVVVDPRNNVLNAWKLEENIKFVNKSFQEAIDVLIFDKQTYVCSLAYTHDKDLEVAAGVLGKDIAYLGIIASKNKARKIAKLLSEKYGYTQEQIGKIDMPIGLPIEVETPAEIAISILAKIIDLRNKSKINADKHQHNTTVSVQTTKYSPFSNQTGD